MHIRFRTAAAVITAFALATSGTAFARAKLLSATPAADASAADVRSLSLTFSEGVIEKLSGVDIVMTGMPGMANHQPMRVVGFKTALAADGKTMTITLPRAMPAGSYKVSWHAVSHDNQRAEGSYSFSAR